MLTLFYIILGWKEYNKPFRKAEQPPKPPAESAEKPDLIPQKKNAAPTPPPKDSKKPDPVKSISTPQPVEPSFFGSKTPETTPKIPETKPNFPAPKAAEEPKMPEPVKVTPKTPETPKVPELPKTTPKTPDAPKIPPRTPETPKVPDFRLAPEIPKKPEAPKTPEPGKVTPGFSKTSPADSFFKPELPKSDSAKIPEGPAGTMPSRRPESVLPDFPPSSRNPAYVPPSNQSEFPIPPYLPGTPQNKPLSSDDELFAVGSTFNKPKPKPIDNLRDLSYAKGEFPGEDAPTKVGENLSRIPRYMEQSAISNPDSLESDEESEDF